MKRITILAALAAILSAHRDATAQLTMPRASALEGYIARASLDATIGGDGRSVDAVGARLLWPLAAGSAGERLSLAQRTVVGGFLERLPAPERGFQAWHAGIQSDLHPLPRALWGRVDPIVSFGVGLVRTQSEPTRRHAPRCFRAMDVPFSQESCLPAAGTSTSHFFVTSPAVGLGIGIVPGLALRADARDLIVYRRQPTHGGEISVGVSLMR